MAVGIGFTTFTIVFLALMLTCIATDAAEKTHCSFAVQPACYAAAVHQFMLLGAVHLDCHDFLHLPPYI